MSQPERGFLKMTNAMTIQQSLNKIIGGNDLTASCFSWTLSARTGLPLEASIHASILGRNASVIRPRAVRSGNPRPAPLARTCLATVWCAQPAQIVSATEPYLLAQELLVGIPGRAESSRGWPAPCRVRQTGPSHLGMVEDVLPVGSVAPGGE